MIDYRTDLAPPNASIEDLDAPFHVVLAAQSLQHFREINGKRVVTFCVQEHTALTLMTDGQTTGGLAEGQTL